MNDETRLPLVSIVMPVRNERAYLDRSLGSVLAQDYPAERLEILVADGRSTDGTREEVERLGRRDPRVRVIDNPAGIVAPGLNRALREARGEIVVRVDGHCEVAPDYVRRCVAHLLAGEAEGVGGPVDTVGETFVARVIAKAMSSGFGVGGSAFRTRRDATELVDTVPFPGYTRAILERAGPFDEELVRNQDDEYNYRLREMGARVLLAADVKSRYWSRGTLRKLARQYFEYGLWKVRVLQKHPAQMKARQFVPPLFVGGLLAGAAASRFVPAARLAAGGVATLYAAANVAASAAARGDLGWRAVPLLSASFAAMHFAYGAGFLAGLVRFGNRWGDRKTRFRPPVEERIPEGGT